jgi:hypothetical protein
MPMRSEKDAWSAGIGRLDGPATPLRILSDRPLEKSHGIAAASLDSNAHVRVPGNVRVSANIPECERTMWLANGRLFLVTALDARGRVRAMARAHVETRADADVGFMGMTATAHADRRRAKLRHISSLGSCSTLLTKIGPAIVSDRAEGRVAVASPAHGRMDEEVVTSGGGVGAKGRVWERAFASWHKRQWSSDVLFQAEADAAISRGVGSWSGRWQGQLFRSPFLTKPRSGDFEKALRADENWAGESEVLQAMASWETADVAPSLAGLSSFLGKLHPDCESYGRVPPNMPHPPLPPNPPTGRPNAPARTHLSS